MVSNSLTTMELQKSVLLCRDGESASTHEWVLDKRVLLESMPDDKHWKKDINNTLLTVTSFLAHGKGLRRALQQLPSASLRS